MREIPTYQPDFEEYIRQGEPDKKERAQIWRTAIGLQQVDGLETSEYLKEVARQHIEGDITFKEVKSLIDTYYETENVRNSADVDEKREADKVSERIANLLSEKAFSFNPAQLVSIHRYLFQGIYKFAGRIRDYNITKKEWVLRGDTVYYEGSNMISAALSYDFEQEKAFDYSKVTLSEAVHHITKFCSDIWQIHPFGEGNTRTTAVFMIKYLRTLGFEVTNDLFAQNSWYFRNALVRANYTNVMQGIQYDTSFLERFFRNLLLGEHHQLLNREMHLEWSDATSPTSTGQVQDKLETSYMEIDNENIIQIVKTIGINRFSIKEIMANMGLKGRDNFLNLYLNPAIASGYIRMLYPDSPNHPRQKYLLTVKGLGWYNTQHVQ